MAGIGCEHPGPLTGGKCGPCGATTCQYGVTGCRCSVGYPYELQCADCRDRENRMDNGYCVCIPSSIPPRKSA